MQPFDYFSPKTLPEAVEILSRHNGDARVVAGGTDLLLKMKGGRLAPKAIVNIKRLAELRGISETSNSKLQTPNYHLPITTIGALTTLEELRRSPIIRERYPSLCDAANTMASVQIRNLATVGGNMCNAAPSADLAPIFIALDASAVIAGPGGERRVPLEEFFVGPGKTVLESGELLASLEAPPPVGPSLYLKHSPRAHMDIAVVGVGLAAQLSGGVCESARIVLGAVAPVPLRVRRAEAELIGGPFSAERIDRAAKIAAEEAQPIDDVRGAVWYRRKMVEVLVRRGLTAIGGIEN
ncbi:MAG: xanthine dehydrogenase family protein subunit M [Chloroflexi bacterium]|nr:xanthine dehydrogenase family protein subunit M [Chloroflexota bacterium]